MTYKGHYRNGVIVLDEPAELEEGAQVEVSPLPGRKPFDPRFATVEEEEAFFENAPSDYDLFKDYIGSLDGPEDLSINHDHYLYGVPKRTERP